MKLMLHYLKYDLRRWWWLLLLVWVLASVYVCCMKGIAEFTSLEGSYKTFGRLEDGVQTAASLALFCGLAMCVLVGGTDSPVRGRSWTMTRPGHRVALCSARCLLIAAGVILPLTLAHSLSLTVLKFSGTGVLIGTGQVLSLLASCALFASLLALIWPCIPGLVVGACLAGIVSLVMLIPALRPPSSWHPVTFSLPGIALAALIGLLPGLLGLRSRQTRREWAMRGMWMGFCQVSAQAALPPLLYFRSQSAIPSSEVAFSDAPVIEVPGAAGSIARRLSVSVPPDFEKLDATMSRVEAVSWRRSSSEPWSAWLPANGQVEHDLGGSLPLDLTSARDLLPEMKDGELRVGVITTVRPDVRVELPGVEGSQATGDTWYAEVGPMQGSAAKPLWSLVVRSLDEVGRHRGAGPEVRTIPANPYESGSLNYRSLPLINLHYFAWGYNSSNTPKDFKFALTPPGDYSQVHHVFHFRGVQHDSRKSISPEPSSSPSPRTWEWETLSQMPRPLIQGAVPEVPEAGATRAEVAAFLTYLTVTEWGYQQGPWEWNDTRRRKFAALVPQWLPVFLKAVVVAGERRGAVLEAAILHGTPEERQAELIARIPESPTLARIALQRGWLAEAKPKLVELFRKAGGIPDRLDSFVTEFRDPVFHPWLRAKFRATVPMIRFWQSVPELAKDLPDLLAAARQRIPSAPSDPNGHGLEEINGLLSTGDAEALDLTIRTYFKTSRQVSWPEDYLRRWLRLADEKRWPDRGDGQVQALQNSKAADFTWNAARGLFIQKPKSSTP